MPDQMHDRLGRRHAPDPRDTAFPLRALLPTTPTDRTYRYWASSFNVDQTGPTCCANAWTHFLGDSPVRTTLGTLDEIINWPAIAYRSPTSGERGFRGYLYHQAQQADEWPETPPEGGTSVRAGAKVLQRLGLIQSYMWSWSAEEVATAILTRGPVVIGVNWYEGMFPDPGGWLVPDWMSLVGGHAVVLDGVNTREAKFRVQTWGQHYWLAHDDLDRLLAEDGEACTALEPGATP